MIYEFIDDGQVIPAGFINKSKFTILEKIQQLLNENTTHFQDDLLQADDFSAS